MKGEWEYAPVKIDRHGQAAILSQCEIERLFNDGFTNDRDRALFGVCLYTACRVAEACSMHVTDVYDGKGKVRPELILRKSNTKGKLATRTIPVIEDLRLLLTAYRPPDGHTFLFPGRHDSHKWKHIAPESASRILREACDRAGLIGVSTHSFRRTALTQMSNAGIPLRVIQTISGHRSLATLQRYLEVSPDQVRGALSSLGTLSYVKKVPFHNLDDSTDANSWSDSDAHIF